MKKMLGILSTLTLASSTTLVLTDNVDNHVQQTKNEKNDVNWNDVKNQTNTYFKNIKNDNKNKTLLFAANDKETNFDETIKYAEEKSNEYIIRFQNQNLNSNEVINILLNENNSFKETYNKSLQLERNFIKNPALNFSTFSNVQDELDKLEKLVKDLRISALSFTTLSATAAVAAAGFWAAAWWFGISIPWATACTIISATSGGVAAGLKIALVKYDKELNKIDKLHTTLGAVITLGQIFPSIAKALLITASSTLTATSWAFPAAFALVPVISAMLAWMKVYE